MNIPAYALSTLRLGRTFDAETFRACSDIFPVGVKTDTTKYNRFSFEYKIVKSSRHVIDLLDISSELSLKIKADLLQVEGTGQYIKENKIEKGTTNLLAVMKCTTEIETIVGNQTPIDDPERSRQGVGRLYVRSITYGAEMVASLKFSSTSTSQVMRGSAGGDLSLPVVNGGLRASLGKLSSQFNGASNIVIKYYATDMPDKLPTTVKDLVSLIENFPSRLKGINKGKGIAMRFELRPTKNIIPSVPDYIQNGVLGYKINKLEDRFDDLRNALTSVRTYQQNATEVHNDIQSFLSEVEGLFDHFYRAISTLSKSEGQKRVDDCLDDYNKALGGHNVLGKFARRWNEILKSKNTGVPIPSFDAATDCRLLRKAMDGVGTDEQALIDIIGKRSNAQRVEIRERYKTMFKKDLMNDLKSGLRGNLEECLLALLEPSDLYDVKCLRLAMKGAGADQKALIDILCTRSNQEINAIKRAYTEYYQRDLERDCDRENVGHFKRLLVSICQAKRDETTTVDMAKAAKEAQDLHQAGVGNWGTDESQFNVVLTSRNFAQLRATFDEYAKAYGHDIMDAIDREMRGYLKAGFKCIVQCTRNPAEYFADRLWKSMKGAGTDDSTLIRCVVSRSERDLVEIEDTFLQKYNETLYEKIDKKCRGDYKELLLTVVGMN